MTNTTVSAPWPHLKRSLVAILRGVLPAEAPGIIDALVDEGFEAIEIPLNSPDAFVSIAAAVKRHGERVLIGAGTVLSPGDVDRLAEAGGRLLVAPNVDPDVLRRAALHAMVTMPGVFTASEAFLALKCGASALKFFPAGTLGAPGIAALGAVLPKGTVVGAVGGVSDQSFAEYAKAGVTAFGLGSSLYKPGNTAQTVRDKARRAIAAYDAAFPSGA